MDIAELGNIFPGQGCQKHGIGLQLVPFLASVPAYFVRKNDNRKGQCWFASSSYFRGMWFVHFLSFLLMNKNKHKDCLTCTMVIVKTFKRNVIVAHLDR